MEKCSTDIHDLIKIYVLSRMYKISRKHHITVSALSTSKVIKREVVTQKISTISAHIFLKLLEFYFGRENIFLLK